MADEGETSSTRRIKIALNVVTLLALAGLVYALRDQIVETVHTIDDINYWLLLLLLPIQFVNYHSYAVMYQQILTALGNKVPYWEMFKAQLELNFINHVFPSGGVSGFSYFGVRMRKVGVSAGKATLVQVMKFGLIFISFQVLIFFGLLCLSVMGRTNNLTILISASIGTLLLVVTLGMAFVISSEKRINSFFAYLTKAINRLIQVVRPKHPETISLAKVREVFTELHENYNLLRKNWRDLKQPLINATLANITEILTIYVVYMAFGLYVNPGAVILAYAVANFAGLISVLPGGVGVYEALMTAVLAAAGVSPAISLPVTVMYRILSTAIQLPPGYYYYHQALHAKPRRHARA